MPAGKTPITLQEAKGWYTGRLNDKARDNITDNRLIYWDGAQNTRLANGTPAVSVPLYYNYRKPLVIAQGSSFQAQKDKLPTLDQPIVDFQKRLIISKDERGEYRCCILVVLPTDAYRMNHKGLSPSNFSGSLLYYNEKETDFWVGMQYNEGRLEQVFRDNPGKQAQSGCYKALYQSQAPTRVEGLKLRLAAKTKQLNIPMIFQDKSGVVYSLFEIVHTDCRTGQIGAPLAN
ncbi:hypothetical protein GCM10028809_00550 [Spirosoma gilvum]